MQQSAIFSKLRVLRHKWLHTVIMSLLSTYQMTHASMGNGKCRDHPDKAVRNSAFFYGFTDFLLFKNLVSCYSSDLCNAVGRT